MLDGLLDASLDALLDTIKILPFLFLTYLVMEWLEHRTEDKTRHAVEKAGHLGPLFGGLLGVIPQCGFSTAASSLFSGRVITLGTLLAIYLSTSDEMLPIFLASGTKNVGLIAKILVVKVLVGVIAGFVVDFVHVTLVRRGILHPRHILPTSTDREILEEEPGTEHIRDLCEQEKCECEKGIFRSTVSHTVQVSLYILLISLMLNALLVFLGEDFLESLLLNRPFLGALVAGVVGLIPNCAASVAISQLFLEGAIGAGALLSGLLVGAGVGLLVLVRTNREWKENLRIIGLLYVIGVFSGLLLGCLPIW